jgi:hypothetical protein
MVRIAGTALAVLLMLATTAYLRADEDKDAKSVIDKGIQAAGGEENLAKFKAMTWKEKGTYYGMGDGLPYTGTYSVQWPGQFKMEIEGVFTIVLNGDTGWMKGEGGGIMELKDEMLAEQKENQYSGWVTHLLPLKEKGFKLASAGEDKVGDKAVVGVKVSHKAHRDVELFFDKETGLLAKSRFKAKDLQQGGKEVTQEAYYSDYKEVNGIKLPFKVVVKRDGKQYVEAENVEVKVLPQLDKSTYSKPGERS